MIDVTRKFITLVVAAALLAALIVLLTVGMASAGKRCTRIGGLRWCFSAQTAKVRDLVGGRRSHSHVPAFAQAIFHLPSGDVVCTHNANAIVVDCQ